MQSRMEAMGLEEVVGVINMLKEENSFTQDYVWFNLVTPFVQRLGYNIFDMRLTKTDVTNKLLKHTIYDVGTEEPVVISAGLKPLRAVDNGVEGTPTDKVVNEYKSMFYMYFDMEELEYVLQIILNQSIFTMIRVDISGKLEEGTKEFSKEENKLGSVSKVVGLTQLKRGYKEYGDKYITSIVVNGLLNSGKVQGNIFIEDIIREELKNPSDDFIKLISRSLFNKYLYGEEREQVVNRLLKNNKESIFGVVTDIVEKDTGMGFSFDSKVESMETKPVDKPENKKQEEDTIKDFKVDVEDKVVEPEDFGIEVEEEVEEENSKEIADTVEDTIEDVVEEYEETKEDSTEEDKTFRLDDLIGGSYSEEEGNTDSFYDTLGGK